MVPTFDKIQHWIEENPREDFLDLPSLARLATNRDAGALSLALSRLVEDGVLLESVAVISPTNYAYALDENGSRMGFWDSEKEIPEYLYDTTLTPFKAGEGEIVSVFRGLVDD